MPAFWEAYHNPQHKRNKFERVGKVTLQTVIPDASDHDSGRYKSWLSKDGSEIFFESPRVPSTLYTGGGQKALFSNRKSELLRLAEDGDETDMKQDYDAFGAFTSSVRGTSANTVITVFKAPAGIKLSNQHFNSGIAKPSLDLKVKMEGVPGMKKSHIPHLKAIVEVMVEGSTIQIRSKAADKEADSEDFLKNLQGMTLDDSSDDDADENMAGQS